MKIDPGDVAALVAATIALAAFVFTWWTTKKQLAMAGEQTKTAREQANTAKDQANTARVQAELQREAYEASMSPNVWFDIWVDQQQAAMMVLRLGNNGAAAARDVKVAIEPPLVANNQGGSAVQDVMHTLSNGITYLPPGRVMEWSLGVSWAVLKDDPVRQRRVAITGRSPYGPFTVPEAIVRLDDFINARAVPPGTLHGVTKALDKLTKAVNGKRSVNTVRDHALADSFEAESPADPTL
jgi:hypothetical protein